MLSVATNTAVINLANLRASVNYRLVEKPPPLAACKNCLFYLCDQDVREGNRGIYTETKNSRCAAHNRMPVARNSVCDTHKFKHSDRRDV